MAPSLRLVVALAAFSALAGCDDKPAPKTAHAHKGHGARAKGTVKPAKRFAEFDALHVERTPFLTAGCVPGKDERTLDCRAAPFVASFGCARPTAKKLVVWDAGRWELVASEDAFKRRFGPPKTAAAALGFALAHGRDARARFDLAFDDPGDVDPDAMPSNVLPRKEGWVVRLFEREPCGCAHPDVAVDWLVNHDGQVTALARAKVHVDPRTEGVCVD